ncbi:MAG TPA: hypothetical protein VFK58_03285 [Sphingomicrobium sp.]|nr:hypothetical protein [Sphingomicrobium sp.]
MQDVVQSRTPAHLWVVGVLALLWNAFGAYDYTMTRLRNTDYLAGMMPGVDPESVLAWVDAFPIYAQFGWGLGVWGGVLGAVLLLARSRHAVWAFAVSLVGMALSLGYQMLRAPPMPGAEALGVMGEVMPLVIIFVGLALLGYAYTQAQKRVLR